ncbi:MAG: hypothetical protein IKA50_03535 [Clostridia bacterium]|nr:hypothetical protein [Clostridia bacterium]
MKKVLSTLLVLCLLLGLTACGSKPTKTENTPTEKKTTTTTAPEEEKFTIQDVKRHVKAASQSNITDEETEKEGDKTIYRFQYMNGCAAVSVIVKDGDIQQINSTLLLSGLTPMPDATAAEMLFLGMCTAAFPAASTYPGGDAIELVRLIYGGEKESDGADNYSFTYEGNGWRYVMVVNSMFVVVSCVPLSSDVATTTTANKVTTSQPATKQPTSAQSVPTPTENKPTATKRPTTSTKANPCANGHDWEEATCSGPATCSVCKKTSGSALPHDIDVAKCRNCDHTDFSKIAKTYSDISAYDLVTGEVYDVQNVKIGSSGVFSFTFNGESYALKLVQKSHSYSYEPMVKFDCYRDGKKEVDAVVEVYTGYDNVRLTWRGLQGCQLYIYAE